MIKTGLYLLVAAGIWLMSAPLLGHMGPPWPCAIAGAFILLFALLLKVHRTKRLPWTLAALMAALGVLLTGMGGVVPALLGISGAALIIGQVFDPEPALAEISHRKPVHRPMEHGGFH